MLVDARQLSAGEVVFASLCIVGAGPAGIALAREFDGAGHPVVLLESGGIVYEPGLQPLGQAARIRMEPRTAKVKPLRARRQFGGNASAWGVDGMRSANSVRLTPLQPIDFEPRDWVPDSGWPFRIGELARHYVRAQAVFSLPPDAGYGPGEWESPEAQRLPLDEGEVETAVFQFGLGGPFHAGYLDQLSKSQNVRVLHHATAVEIETDPAGAAATGVRVATLPGREFRVCAPVVVLSGGAMATTQLLLSSRAAAPEGLGNRHGLVGRYYMDHPILQAGYFVPAAPDLIRRAAFYDMRLVDGVPVMGHLRIAEPALRRERLPQITMMLYPRVEADDPDAGRSQRQQVGVEAATRLRRAIRRRELPYASDVGRAILGADGIAAAALRRRPKPEWTLERGGWSQQASEASPFRSFEVFQQVEQPPRRDNRVFLSDARDALGCRRLSIDWRWHDEDIADAMRAQDFLAEALRRSGLGRFEPARTGGLPRVRALSTSHYMGTTRMHDDPRQGVVDAEGEVHGVNNLFVASSSVFPTGGFANPTLTIVALALRVADLIRGRLDAAPAVGEASLHAPAAEPLHAAE